MLQLNRIEMRENKSSYPPVRITTYVWHTQRMGGRIKDSPRPVGVPTIYAISRVVSKMLEVVH